MLEHDPVTIGDFNGLFDRGSDESVPIDHFSSAQNLEFTHRGFKTRTGFGVETTYTFTPVRAFVYKRIGEVDRLLLLDTTGKIWDSNNLGLGPILDKPGTVDFSVLVMFNRAYITLHDRDKGKAGEFIYVYQGSGVCRKAAGLPPSGFTFSTAQGGAGRIEKGKHVIGICFETDTGFITKPGGLIVYDALVKDKTVIMSTNLPGIPQGPAGTVDRKFVASRVQAATWNGDVNHVELFFVPNGNIGNNNPVVTKELDFYDSDLVDSADYLMDNHSELPATLGLMNYGGSMVGWTRNADESTFWVSKNGNPETVSTVDGFVRVDPGVGGPIRNIIENRGLLYITKSIGFYMTQDNAVAPVTWKVIPVDSAVGTECFGFSTVLDSRGNTLDRFLVASREGLRMFTGTFADRELTWKISDVWGRINKAKFNTIQVLVDPVKQRIYVSVPLDGATSPNYVLMGDYSNGLDAYNIKWCPWRFQLHSPHSIFLMLDANQDPIFKYLNNGGTELFRLEAGRHNDNNTAIDAWGETALIPEDDFGGVNHFVGVRLKAVGLGVVKVTVSGIDRVTTLNAKDITLSSAPGMELPRGFNFKSERASVKLRSDVLNDWFDISRVRVFTKPLYGSRPGI